jgi:ribonucleotide monophosphatase NagD (HAD superfamily)
MVGDHLIADIAGARQGGLPTILVLSGVTAKEDLEGAAIAPELVLGSVAEHPELLTSRRRQGRTTRT